MQLSTRSLTMANGYVLQFTSEDVPRPPTANFSSNILLLGRMWNDQWAEWDGSSFLKIKGIDIPLVYWKDIFSARSSKGEPSVWKTLKARWGEWKVGVTSLLPVYQQF
jgi:hypothetical protein